MVHICKLPSMRVWRCKMSKNPVKKNIYSKLSAYQVPLNWFRQNINFISPAHVQADDMAKFQGQQSYYSIPRKNPD